MRNEPILRGRSLPLGVDRRKEVVFAMGGRVIPTDVGRSFRGDSADPEYLTQAYPHVRAQRGY